MATTINHRAIDGIVRRNISALRKPGALTVRPGFKMTGGWITDKPAIVVTVDKKLDALKPSDKLPAEINDVPLDVREATGLQRLRAKNPTAHALVVAHGRSENKEPIWKFERSLPDGKLLSQAPQPQHVSLQQMSKKPQLKYSAPPQPLAAATRNMTIIAHASPDDGFPVLTDFLAQTKNHLTVAMYDFTSAELLHAVTGAIKSGSKPFQMVLDHPPRNDTANQTDDVTAQTLEQAEPNAKVNWALTRNDPKATEWIFPSAYHIKVAVRDSAAFWLSSGNWNVSNQPDFKANNPSAGDLSTSDRDWHVVVLDPGLAQLFEAYIRHDFTMAAAGQGAGSAALHSDIHNAMVAHSVEQQKSSFVRAITKVVKHPKPSKLGMHKVFSNVPVTVQPLLTPDPGVMTTMYVDKVMALIKSAKRSIYVQTQYIHPSDKPEDQNFTALVEALSAAEKKGLDVRLITSQFENTPQWIEKLKVFDLDRVLRVQIRTHNKGIIVDSKAVMVSSQNWSADGTLRNRDAGLIIENAEIAAYFEAIFIDDWTTRATQKVIDASVQAKATSSTKGKSSPKATAKRKAKKKTASR